MAPLYLDYERLTQAGTKPPLARLTLARRIAAIILAMWKNQEVYDPARTQTSAQLRRASCALPFRTRLSGDILRIAGSVVVPVGKATPGPPGFPALSAPQLTRPVDLSPAAPNRLEA